MNLRQGTLLQAGKYRIECVLGQGGFGVTYLATQVRLNRRVAIKEFFMSEYCNRDADSSHVTVPSEGSKELVAKFRNKFIKEAQNIACLKHPHIISIHDVFEDNGTAYYVMEYHAHGSLADMVKRQVRLSEADALRYTRQIADALRYIHARKMNHLDVKPGNILIDDTDHAVLIDFGLSKRYDDEGNQTSTTPVGISHGYAPLEQYKKNGVGTFSPVTDIYSLGATLYKLITGITPPDANDVREDGLPPLPVYVSATMGMSIEQAMQPRRKDRPQSIEAFLALLDVVKDDILVEDERTVMIGNDEGGIGEDKTSYVDVDPENDDACGDGYDSGEPKSRSIVKNFFWPVVGCLVVIAVCLGWQYYSTDVERMERLQAIAQEREGYIQEDIDPVFVDSTEGDGIWAAANGHEYVDLGLSVQWATCNVGASSPSDLGYRYAWGETEVKTDYSQETYVHYDRSKRHNIYLGDNISGTRYDVASTYWGGIWRLPTKEEFQELIDKCSWTWESQDGYDGFRVSASNGNSIFLPAILSGNDEYGDYWSATSDGGQYAYHLYFNNSHSRIYIGRRYSGICIRPVIDREKDG